MSLRWTRNKFLAHAGGVIRIEDPAWNQIAQSRNIY